MTEMPSQKRCPKCRKTKSITEFGSHRGRPDGHQPTCKACVNAIFRERRSTPEGRAANVAAWYRSRDKSQRALGIS
jgi:hypothetical protein